MPTTLQRQTTTPADGAVALPSLPKFAPDDGFRCALRQCVDAYFANSGRRRRDNPAMYRKSAIVLSCLVATYLLLLLARLAWWLVLPLTILLGLSLAAVGFNVQHDGGHGAYSGRRWINRLAAMTLDLLGASSYVWARKHNAIHHSFTNIANQDDDIDVGWLARLSPHQPHHWFHRLQHVYMWFFYGFLPLKWHFHDDFRDVGMGRIGEHRLARPRGSDLLTFIGGKTLFFTLAFGLPLLLHPWWVVLPVYLAASFVQGVVLSVVFQLAHCVEEAEFPLPATDTGRMPTAWAKHQLQTSVDFAADNNLLTWFVGGLNFQIEHHLFPQICHIHYPAIAPLVQQTCREFGVRYTAQPSLPSAIASHFRWLRRMGLASGAARAREHAGQTAQAAADHVRSQDTGRHDEGGVRPGGRLATSKEGH